MSNKKQSTIGSPIPFIWAPCLIVIIVFNIFVGGFCVDYVLNTAFGIDIPWYSDATIGLVAGELSVPAAILTWILHFFVAMPFF